MHKQSNLTNSFQIYQNLAYFWKLYLILHINKLLKIAFKNLYTPDATNLTQSCCHNFKIIWTTLHLIFSLSLRTPENPQKSDNSCIGFLHFSNSFLFFPKIWSLTSYDIRSIFQRLFFFQIWTTRRKLLD